MLSHTCARRQAKTEVIAQASQQHLPTKPSDPLCAYDQYTKQLLRLDRYERRALSYPQPTYAGELNAAVNSSGK
jgi:hypothetical protein